MQSPLELANNFVVKNCTPLELARAARTLNRLAGVSVRVDNPIVRNLEEPGRKNAIFAMCARCMGCTKDSIEPGFKKDIRTCSDTECPIYDFRPYQKKDAEEIVDGI